MSPEVSEETSDMPSRGSGSGTASGSASGTMADDVVEPPSSRCRFEGRSVDSSYSWTSSSYCSDSSIDESGDSGGDESRAMFALWTLRRVSFADS